MLKQNPKMSVGDAVKKMLDTWMPPPRRSNHSSMNNINQQMRISRSQLVMKQEE